MALFRCGAGSSNLNVTLLQHDTANYTINMKKDNIYALNVRTGGSTMNDLAVTGINTTPIAMANYTNADAGSGFWHFTYYFKADETGSATVTANAIMSLTVYEIEA